MSGFDLTILWDLVNNSYNKVTDSEEFESRKIHWRIFERNIKKRFM